MGSVIGVLGASGGLGASTFAAVLAVVAGPALLVDLDEAAGGVDVLLGLEGTAGARWSGLHLAGGYLDPAALVDGLPRWGPVAVLAADTPGIAVGAVDQVVAAGRSAGAVLLDLPRAPSSLRAQALAHCDLVVVLTRGDVAGLVAGRAQVTELPPVPTGLVLRRGEVGPSEAARVVGRPVLGSLPPLPHAGRRLDPGRLPRASARVAAGVLAGLARPTRHRAGVSP